MIGGNDEASIGQDDLHREKNSQLGWSSNSFVENQTDELKLLDSWFTAMGSA